MEHALGIARGSGGVDCVCRVMIVGGLVACKGLAFHDFAHGLGIQFKLAAAVFADIVDSFRCVGVFYQSPGSTGFPYAEHGYDGHDASGQIDQNKVFLADAFLFQICVNASGEIV